MEKKMATKIFVNLPVKSLDKSMAFFKRLGYGFNAQFTDETAACMVVSEDIYVILLTHDKFKSFTPKAIADATKSTEVQSALVALCTGMMRWRTQSLSDVGKVPRGSVLAFLCATRSRT